MKALFGLLATLLVAICAQAVEYPAVAPGYLIQFPRDEGSHPQFQTEWWYLTGWLEAADGRTFGFQVTFFRHRPGTDEENPSRFAAKQVLFAHGSLSDPKTGRLLRAEKISRAGFGLAAAREGELDVRIDDWNLRRASPQTIETRIATDEFEFALTFNETQPPLVQGNGGFSQKGPRAESASYYYSLPQLSAQGVVRSQSGAVNVRGVAWLDHEWFSAIMDAQARGWDWVGLNFDDGSALMAFQMRDERHGKYWAAATSRNRQGETTAFARDDIEWQPTRRWRSARTGIEYPIEWRVRTGARWLTVRPLMDDQENDARGSTGTIYWEGAVRVFDEAGAPIGRGYLELTGYGERIRF